MTASEPVIETIVRRANERFATHKDRVYRESDRAFAWLMFAQWLFAIAVAVIFSPYAWDGKVRTIHSHVYVAVVLGGLLSSLPIALAVTRPGWVVTRHVIASAQMLWSALLIH